MKWLPCELHCHTYHSDGKFSPNELQRAARENSLELIALTDHNTFSGCAEFDESIIPAISGIEWTSYYGHILVLGAKGFVDWRDATPQNIEEKLNDVKKRGAVIGIAHPFQLGSPFCTGGRYEFDIKDYSNIDYIEIFHEAFSIENSENIKALEFWSELLDKGYHIAATYGRDWHSNEAKGCFGCTYIGFNEDVSSADALDSVKRGRTIASSGEKLVFSIIQNEKAYQIGDTASEGEAIINISCDFKKRNGFIESENAKEWEIRILTNHSECIYKTKEPQTKDLELNIIKNHWYRAELWCTIGEKEIPAAITSPIYVK